MKKQPFGELLRVVELEAVICVICQIDENFWAILGDPVHEHVERLNCQGSADDNEEICILISEFFLAFGEFLGEAFAKECDFRLDGTVAILSLGAVHDLTGSDLPIHFLSVILLFAFSTNCSKIGTMSLYYFILREAS